MADKNFVPVAAGLTALIQELGLRTPAPAIRSEIVSGARRTQSTGAITVEQYPKSYAPANGLAGQLKFALRYEPVDLGVLYAVFHTLDARSLESWIRREPTSIYARRAWYLYEQLTSKTLDIPDVVPVGYANLLDPARHLTGTARRAHRQRINDNLLGDASYCPLIRRTETLIAAISEGLDRHTRSLVEGCEPSILARAVQYLYTQETKSSFAIEGEAISPGRAQRFVSALALAASFDSGNRQSFIQLQNEIVDSRYAASGWRTTQNYVGQTMSNYQEYVHFVSPKPEDVPSLMEGWMRCAARLHESRVDPVCAAAASSFGFVFIHPFDDGNGRIHRFLIHHTLAREGFTPQGMLFPVSAVMLRSRHAYDRILNSYAKPLLPLIDYHLDDKGSMTVSNQTAPLYRYWDATAFAEYLYSCVAETIRRDLKEEIGFLQLFDAAIRATIEIVDMPDRRASLLVRLILQNKGRLSAAKREQFSELKDEEISAIETAISQAAVK